MRLSTLAVKNVWRNKLRTVLTILAVAIAILLFVTLRTVISAWTSAIDASAKDRIATRHKITFIMTLPVKYVEDIRQIPGVEQATWMNWFGGKDPNRENEFFATIAVDKDSFLDVYDEIIVPPDQAEAWKQNRRGALVGDVLARKLGWNVGDTVTIRGTIFPGNWEFEIEGIYEAKRRSVDRSSFWFHWDYLNESQSGPTKDQIGWIVSRIDDPAKSADISAAIDAKFDERDVQTITMSERAMQASFMGMFSAVLTAIDLMSLVILGIMLLILANTIAMGVRERTSEYGVLRAIGFRPPHIAQFIVAESTFVGLIGGLIGLGLAYPLVEMGLGRFLEENMGGMFPYFRIANATVIAAIVLSAALGAVAGLVPAYQASRLDVVDSLRRVG